MFEKETIYIAGAITGNSNYPADFRIAENHLKETGFEKILNPTVLPDNLEHEQYMKICFSMIDVSDTVYFLRNWRDSDGATREYYYAMSQKKKIIFEGVF